ncbi:MAG TPA: ABC transporter permease [Bacillota bacterium]
MRLARSLRGHAIRFGSAWRMAWHGVLANPLRSALTVLSVMIGVASVVTLISIGEGARQAVIEQFESLGENVILIEAQDTSIEFPADLADDLLQRVPTLRYATPVVEVESTLRWRRARGSAEVLGTNAQFPAIRDHALVAGSFFTDLHVQQRAPVAVLGYNYGVGLLRGRSPVGQWITLGGRSFRIIGVLAPKGAGQAGGIDDKIVIPYTVAQQLAEKRTVDQIWVKAASPADADLAVAQLGRIFRRQIGIDPAAPSPGQGGEEGSPEGEPLPPGEKGELLMHEGGRRVVARLARPVPAEVAPGGGEGGESGQGGGTTLPATRPDELVTITNLNQAVKRADEANRIMTLLLGGIAAVSLLVGGIGIMNIMLVSVSERTAEIGLRKALGAKRGDLLTQFLLEAFLLSGAGGLLGLTVGRGSAGIVARYGLEVASTPEAAVVAVAAALGVGVLFGGYPAWLASGLEPVEALRRP